jgi:hypothetical protein
MTSVRSWIALAGWVLWIGPAVAAPSALTMDSREAPAAEKRPEMKAFSLPEIAATPLIVLPDLPAPSSAELLQRDAMVASNPGSLSYGRLPMQLGVDGRIDVPAGSRSVRVVIGSPSALHLRTAWRFADDAEYAVTVFAGGDPAQPLENRTGSSMNGDRQLVWSAITQGDRQEALITRLDDKDSAWTVSVERIAHFDHPINPVQPRSRMKGLAARSKDLGDSAYCQLDVACAIGGLSPGEQPAVLDATHAVALMVLTTSTGSTTTCTGTLLNSAAYPKPFLLTAYHCLAGAAALETYWFFSRTGCGVGTVNPAVQSTGGATIVFLSQPLDSALLVLRQMPPAGVSYIGWDATTLPMNAQIFAIHYPRGDVEKGSLGVVVGTNSTLTSISGAGLFPPDQMYLVNWQFGIVEPGSSGSALFSFNQDASAMQVRGTLTGGNATCAGGPSLAFYQRFDLIYPQIAAALTTPAPSFIPVAGVWWNKNEPGSGFGIDYQNGTLIVEVYSYLTAGPSQWYLASGPVTNNVFQATLDKYTGGQCISCTYIAPSLMGNDGTITITFTSATTATVDLPGGRHIQIQRYFQH